MSSEQGRALNPKPSVSLTQDEFDILNHLASAWNAFVSLSAKHPDHNNEFRDAINRCQYIIGTRVAQRVNPEAWYVPAELGKVGE